MDYLNTDFYKNSIKINKKIKNWKIREIKFPNYKFLEYGETYYYQLIKEIDNSKDFIFIVSYTFENNFIANIILQKLKLAVERGIIVNLLVDDLQSNLNKEIEQKIIELGGNIFKINKINKFWNVFNRELFKREHEKVILIDNKVILGSANIGHEYGGKHYGKFFFQDLNILIKNNCLNQTRFLFQILGEYFDLKFHKEKSNNELFNLYENKYPDSYFKIEINEKSNIIKSIEPEILEIQKFLLENIKKSKKNIRIVAPYYVPIKKIDNALIEASKRGVKVELITAKKRDIPCYKDFRNSILFEKLIKNNIKVFEFKDKYLHTKTFLFDDEYLSIGSFNLDKFSWKNNNEVNFNTNNSNIIKNYFEIYNNIKSLSVEVNKKEPLNFRRYLRVVFWEFFLTVTHGLLMYQDRFNYLKNKIED